MWSTSRPSRTSPLWVPVLLTLATFVGGQLQMGSSNGGALVFLDDTGALNIDVRDRNKEANATSTILVNSVDVLNAFEQMMPALRALKGKPMSDGPLPSEPVQTTCILRDGLGNLHINNTRNKPIFFNGIDINLHLKELVMMGITALSPDHLSTFMDRAHPYQRQEHNDAEIRLTDDGFFHIQSATNMTVFVNGHDLLGLLAGADIALRPTASPTQSPTEHVPVCTLYRSGCYFHHIGDPTYDPETDGTWLGTAEECRQFCIQIGKKYCSLANDGPRGLRCEGISKWEEGTDLICCGGACGCGSRACYLGTWICE